MTEVVTTASARGQVVPVTDYSRMSMSDRMKYANTLAGAADLIKRGLFDKATGKPSPAKIFLVLETGSMLGLHPMASLQGIDVIEGNATISPQLMTGLIRAAGHKLRIVKSGTIEGGDFQVTVTGIRSDDPDFPVTDTWTPHRAARAGLCTYALNQATGIWEIRARSAQKGEPLPWEKYPENLCVWRTTGNVGREGFNDVLMGVGYTPEEFDIAISEDGTVEQGMGIEVEDGFVARIRAIDDKADAAALFHELDATENWTPRIRAEFDAHIASVTKDSRPPRNGAPGHTGVAELDQGPVVVNERPTADAEPTNADVNPASPVPELADAGKTSENGAQRIGESDVADWEAEEIRRYEAEQEAEIAARGEAEQERRADLTGNGEGLRDE